jgi:hypothetical protein
MTLENKKRLIGEIIDQISGENFSPSSCSFTKALELYKSGIKFYRGINSIDEYFIQKAKYRKSIGESNIHTILFSEVLDSWKQYPKRNNCIIFSTSKDEARKYVKDYGSLYSVFPPDNSILAISPTANIWDAFNISIKDINSIFVKLGDYYTKNDLNDIEHLKTFLEYLDERAKNDIRSLVENCEEIVKNSQNNFSSIYKIMNFVKKMFESDNCIQHLNDYMDPSKNSFHLNHITDDLSFLNDSNLEIWTEQPSLMIRTDMIEEWEMK